MRNMPEVDWKRPYRYLAALYYVLVTVTGLIVFLVHRSFWSRYIHPIELDRLFLSAALLYAVLDLIRIPFPGGSIISLSFPVSLTALLASSNPTGAILIAVIGSLLSELAYSLIYRRLEPGLALMRALLYAGHHAVAGFAAAIAFLLLNPSLGLAIAHLPAIVAYVLVYGVISMVVLGPHDWWVSHLLAPEEERLPRVEIISTAVVMTPIPIVLNYIYDLAKGAWVVYLLPFLFLALLLLARSFAKSEVENSRLRIGRFAQAQIGSPPNLAELTINAFDGAGRLVRYRWGAMYSREDSGEPFRLRGRRHADGTVDTYGLRAHKKPASGPEPPLVEWPEIIGLEDGSLGEVARQGAPLVAFERTGLAPGNSPRLPANTAFVALPLRAEGAKGPVIGLLALARPRKLFTLAERQKAQALTEALGGVLYSVQRLESRLQDLYEEIERFGQPEIVQQALDELIRVNVDMPRLMAAISGRTLQTNLRAVLREMVTGRDQGGRLTLSPNELEEVYKEVQDQAKGMPPWSPEILGKLQTVISALTLAFSFRYQWPELARSPEYEGLYKALAEALDASTVPDILAQGSNIERTIKDFQRSPLHAREEICKQLEQFQKVVALLREAEMVAVDARVAYLNDALHSLRAAEESVQKKLEDPERFTLVRIATTWQAVVTNALYAAQEGGAQLAMTLGSNRVLPLEEVTVQLRLENRGPGLASGVVAEVQPSEDYQIGEAGRVELGPLPAGDGRELYFKIRPHRGHDMLRLAFQITYRDRERREKHEEFADRVYLREALTPFTRIDNPYVTGKALTKGSPLFFGREDVFRFIRQHLAGSARGKHVLLLIGERRTGKTSIIKQLPDRLRDEPYIYVFFDCQGLADPGLDGFFLKLSSAIAKGVREAGLSLEGLLPDELKGQPQYVFEEKFLPKVWECIGDRSLLLAIDEFEALETRVQEGRLDPVIFFYLRSLMQSQEKMAFLVVGTHRIEELAADYWSVLFNIAKSTRISFLDQESAVQLITEPVRPCGVVYDDLALAEILRLTAGHPYFLQLVCDCLIESCNELERNYVTMQDVRDARDEILGQGRTHLLFVWQQSSREEWAVLAALTSLLQSGQQVTAADIVECLADRIGRLTDHMDFDLQVVTRALERLIARDIIAETSQEPPSYVFAADLYCELIAKYKSLYRVVPELIKETV